MKKNKTILVVLLLFITFVSCKNSTTESITNKDITYQCPMKCEGEKTFTDKGSCSVCKMDLKLVATVSKKVVSNEISDESIFNLTSKWNTEEGNVIELKDLRGKTLVMVMIYTTCKAACPRLVADMRNIEKQVPKEYNNDLRYVLVSIDPETDTPEKLKAFAKENLMDDEHWTFLQGTKTSVREFANVLAVKYKEISPLDFSHSNIISVFNSEGELVHQQEGLGVDNKETILKIKETVTK
ncbi:SCO family protein [Tenacibaculum sp. Bg11-29]|uniref:SCO family protein n=1 Tax=Tenacibaculum sp. Bg11-29 TaxID=2058306 RepID=UPI000C31EF17|nr:SCO family protein [Tenacibaculum sp. Bg11-29]PKH51570.1 SCO family protein [Tenacibaculum sp. Bg11-29]